MAERMCLKMEIFDGVLICSDIDGTLTSNGRVSEENVKYIKYFMENDHRFCGADESS